MMIDKAKIEGTVNDLNAKYNNKSSTNDDMLLYSKLAVMEFCGWIEESFDLILREYMTKVNIDNANIDFINKNIIRPFSSFEYQKLKFLLLSMFGIKNIQTIETAIGTDFEKFKSILGTFQDKRNKIAHTFISGTQQQIAAPSEVLTNLTNLFPIMQKLETEVNRL